MSTPLQQRSPFIRWLDAFLQEENIKWVLGLGVCILLGSSLRLVTLHWVEYTPVWKYLILLAYTTAVFGLSELSYHRLGLRKTGTVLMSLTVLLIPLSFLALHWIQPRTDAWAIDGLRNTGLTALLALNLAWSAFASGRIFLHFLRRNQPTFQVCYLILCVSGAIIPGLPTALSPILALFLWAVFAVGTVKVNRHVFWLTEEHRLPRIFGFFPIALLGAQFAAVFALCLARQISGPWFGLLSTLISLPVLLTADAVARVFEQQTGGLVRPIPWSISGPLALGTLLSGTGVVLALTGWPANTAIVPTAVIAAVAMGIVAHRTQKSAFAWGMVVCIMIAYQTSPVFFKELVLQIRDQAAAAVKESRLPYSFYGLTYAPLIAVFTVAGATLLRRGNRLFGLPLQITATTLSLLLVAVSFSHPSAVFPVALVQCPMFVLQTILFRQRYYLIPAAVTFLAAAFGVPEFADRVLDWKMLPEQRLFLWSVASGLLFAPGFLCDRWARTLPRTEEDPLYASVLSNVCQLFGLAGTIAAAIVWTSQSNPTALAADFGTASMVAIFIALLLAGHALRWLKLGLGEVTLTYATYVGVWHGMQADLGPKSCLDCLVLLLLAQWGLSYLLERFATLRIARAFGPASFHVSAFGLTVVMGPFVVAWLVQHVTVFDPGITSLLMMAWALDASRRIGRTNYTVITWCSWFIFVSAAFTQTIGPQQAVPWWMAVWTLTGLVLLCISRRWDAMADKNWRPAVGGFGEVGRPAPNAAPGLRQSPPTPATLDGTSKLRAWLSPLSVILPLLFISIAAISLMFLGWPQRIAGLLALCGLAATEPGKLRCGAIAAVGPLLNWHLLAAFVAAWTGMTGLLGELTMAQMVVCGLPLAAFAALSAWAFESRLLRRWIPFTELLAVHQVLLLAVAVGMLFGAVHWYQGGLWTPINTAWAATVCVAITGMAVTSAVRTQEADRAWLSEWTILGSIVYFSLIGVLTWKTHETMYVVLAAGLLHWMIGTWVEKFSHLKILSEPLRVMGFWLPLCVLPLALVRDLCGTDVVWAGANSLPLLGAAAFYFWRGLQQRHVGTTLLSAAILNTACMLLWKDLGWTDPQLFMVPIGVSFLVITELLRQEIPAQFHDRLRLIGALIILVSPTFHIVTGSWLHILTLMIASSALALVAIGLRIRTLLYTSTAFLLADLVALIARSSVDEPNVLWIAGVVLGTSIIALGAICENHRETVLARLRCLAAELEQWN